MGTCCTDVSAKNEAEYEIEGNEIQIVSSGKKNPVCQKSLRDMIAYGDPKAIALLMRLQFRMR